MSGSTTFSLHVRLHYYLFLDSAISMLTTLDRLRSNILQLVGVFSVDLCERYACPVTRITSYLIIG